MKTDIHAYTGHWPFRQLPGNTCEALIQRMNRFHVDKAVLSNINGIFYKNTQTANEELYHTIQQNKEFRDRLIPFAVINPTYTRWQYDLETCVHKFGMRGVRVYPLYHDYAIDNPALVTLLKMARDLNVPVAFTQRQVDTRQRSWMDQYNGTERLSDLLLLNDIAPVINEVPDGKYIILHATPGNESNEVTDILKKLNVVFDSVRACGVPITGFNCYDLLQTIETYGIEKIAFGTATPFMDYCSPFIRIEVLKPHEADEQMKNYIWTDNTQRMLGLS